MAPPKVEYATKEEAVDAFKACLIELVQKGDWTWEQTLRVICKDPRYASPSHVSQHTARVHRSQYRREGGVPGRSREGTEWKEQRVRALGTACNAVN